jgi:hypothetical protein
MRDVYHFEEILKFLIFKGNGQGYAGGDPIKVSDDCSGRP